MLETFMVLPNGETVINAARRDVKGAIIVPTQANQTFTVAAMSGTNPTRSAPISLEGPQDGVSLIKNFTGVFDPGVAADVQSRFVLDIEDMAWQRRLMNRSILVNHIFGTPQFPARLKYPTLLEGRQTMIFRFENRSTAGSAIYSFASGARKFQHDVMSQPAYKADLDVLRDRAASFNPYWLTTDRAVSVPAGGVAKQFFTCTRDQYLLLLDLRGSVITTGGDTMANITIELLDAKTNRALQSGPVSMKCMCGTAAQPFPLPTPILMEPQTTMQATFRNSGSAAIEVFMTFFAVAGLNRKISLVSPSLIATGQRLLIKDREQRSIVV